MDRSEYTCYPLEREILLQAGISAKVEFSYEKSVNGESFTVFYLYISEELVKNSKRRAKLLIIIPFIVFFVIQAIEAEMQIQTEYYKEYYSTLIIETVAGAKLLSTMTFIPLLIKYKLYSMSPVILASIAEIVGWYLTM